MVQSNLWGKLKIGTNKVPDLGPTKSFEPLLLAFIRRGPPDPGVPAGWPDIGVPTWPGWPVNHIIGMMNIFSAKANDIILYAGDVYLVLFCFVLIMAMCVFKIHSKW